MFKELVLKNRSYRRFYQESKIDLKTLTELVEFTRMCASSANLQPLKYILSANADKNEEIFTCLLWAGYLENWAGPEEGEKPSAYIVILGDTKINKTFNCDHGIAAQTILLAACEKGLGGCMIASIDKKKLRSRLAIPDHLEILLVLALGKPKEKVVLESIKTGGDIKYWRDDEEVHHVPKRSLEEMIISSI